MIDLSLPQRTVAENMSTVSYGFTDDVFEYNYYLASQAYFQQYAIDIYIPEVVVWTNNYLKSAVNLIQTFYQNQEGVYGKYLRMGKLIPQTQHQNVLYANYAAFRNNYNARKTTEWLQHYSKSSDNAIVTFNQYRNILFDAAMVPLILPCIHVRYNTEVRQEYGKAISLDEPTKSPHKVILLNKRLMEGGRDAIYKGLMKELPATYDCRICEDTSATNLNMRDFLHKLSKPKMKVNAKWTLPTL